MADIKRFGSRDQSNTGRFCAAGPSLRSTKLPELGCGGGDFDPVAWMAIVEDQKLMIARAAGVDPSKVRIQIGH